MDLYEQELVVRRRVGQQALLVKQLVDTQVRAVREFAVFLTECRTTGLGGQLVLPAIALVGVSRGLRVARVFGDHDRIGSRCIQRS